jgi:hypothetical protein
MAFIQIIEMRTTKFEEMQAIDDDWEKATEGRRTTRRTIVTRDHNDPEVVRVIVFFDDYESAMVNSNLPETEAFGARWAELAEGPPVFIDLDVVDDREG